MKHLFRLMAVCAMLLLCTQTAHAGWFDWLYEPNVKVKIPTEFYQTVDKIVAQGNQLNATLQGVPPQMRKEMEKTIDHFQVRLHQSIEQGKFAALEVISSAINQTDEMLQKRIAQLGEELRKTVSEAGRAADEAISASSKAAKGVIDYGSESFRVQMLEMLSTLHLNINQELEIADLIAQNRMADFYDRLESYTGHTLGIADTMAQRRIEQIFVGTDASLDRLQDIVDGSMDKLGLVLDTSIDKLEGVGNSWLDKSDSIAKERLNQGDLILQRNIQAMGNQGERLSVNTFERLSKLLILALIIFLIGFVSVKTIQEKELRLQPIKIVGIAAVLALGIFFMTQDGALHSVIAVENEQIPAGINVPYPQQPEDTRLAKGSLE